MPRGGTRTPVKLPRENTRKNAPADVRKIRSYARQSRPDDLDPEVQAGLERQDAGETGGPPPGFDEGGRPIKKASSRPGGSRSSGSRGRPGTRPRPSPRAPRATRKAISPGQPSLRRPLGQRVAVGAGTGLAGVFLGAIVYAVALSVVEFGSKGPGMWFRAKFMDQVTSPTAPSSSGGSTAPPSGANPLNPPPVSGPTPSNPTAPTVTPGFPIH